ncbi:hypothetical protein D3C79_1040350 [compost metagenome]
MAMVPIPLPIRLVTARASLRNLSMPKSRTRPTNGMEWMVVSVAARVMNPAPATPAEPFEVRRNTPNRII